MEPHATVIWNQVQQWFGTTCNSDLQPRATVIWNHVLQWYGTKCHSDLEPSTTVIWNHMQQWSGNKCHSDLEPSTTVIWNQVQKWFGAKCHSDLHEYESYISNVVNIIKYPWYEIHEMNAYCIRSLGCFISKTKEQISLKSCVQKGCQVNIILVHICPIQAQLLGPLSQWVPHDLSSG
jgi:hypothetical protein